jgi:hypothetical protein
MPATATRKARTAAVKGPAQPVTMNLENLTVTTEGTTVTMTFDITGNLGESSSGKSDIVATSGGNIPVPGVPGLKMGLNVFRPRKAAA